MCIHDKIDTNDELFPDTKPSKVLEMMGSLPEQCIPHSQQVQCQTDKRPTLRSYKEKEPE